MKTFHRIEQEFQDKQSALFKEMRVFFAFSKEQFDEQKQEGVQYYSMNYGMLISKNNCEAFMEAHAKLVEEKRAECKARVSRDEYILYELHNHESFYTGDTSDALNAVRSNFPECTDDDIRRVYQNFISKRNR